MSATLRCPLCHSPAEGRVAEIRDRVYLGCGVCGLVYLSPDLRLDARGERARYETHENDPGDPGYRAFLNQVAEPLAARLPEGARGLDFGSGPGPTLSLMLAERGFPTRIHDPFFAPDPEALTGEARYHFITCTETAEHFFEPGFEFDRLARLLRPGGWLAMMTELVPTDVPFESWYYARDPTHVAFYREATLTWLAHRHAWRAHRVSPRVTLFQAAGT
ncbi:MAG: class I SAM-dependent methyltransferase [Gemmatimonadales bacterium]|nr:MAG: class I SAM-dependent methyltransferase [Gemmatimonadales bacterium]